jgi:hypothetical protein
MAACIDLSLVSMVLVRQFEGVGPFFQEVLELEVVHLRATAHNAIALLET